MTKSKTINFSKGIIGLLLLVMALIATFPFIYMVLISFTQKQVLDFTFNFSEFSMVNYQRVFRNFNILTNLKNSIIVTGIACLLNCLLSSIGKILFRLHQEQFGLGIR